ncbi:MAG: hypothetical protein R2942_06030 [Ignavibacteria bacterium]
MMNNPRAELRSTTSGFGINFTLPSSVVSRPEYINSFEYSSRAIVISISSKSCQVFA